MKILVIGQGGREHAIVRALNQSTSVSEVHVVPGNSGISLEAQCHEVSWQEKESLLELCKKNQFDVIIIGPEDPLVEGVADFLRQHGFQVVGPNRLGAQLEGSKIFAKNFMLQAGVPTARFEVVTSTHEVLQAAQRFNPPYILKADGLAAGKGVFICDHIGELKSAAQEIFEKKSLGTAGERALLEEYLPGWEMSYLILTNGVDFQALPIAQDHKRLMDYNRGPNTGGMGTVAPVAIDNTLKGQIDDLIVRPTLRKLQGDHISYFGVIFFGLMITPRGPYLLEYNCRLGDPETQVILPLIANDWGEVFQKLAGGVLLPLQIKKNIFSTCIVMAAPGYPQSPKKGVHIEGDITASSESSYFIHAATGRTKSGSWVTNGGRVLCAIGLGASAEESRNAAYLQVEKVKWPGLQMRTDIGAQAPKM